MQVIIYKKIQHSYKKIKLDKVSKFTSKSCENNTCSSKANLSVVKILKQIIFMSDDELQLNTVGHDNDDQSQNCHHSLLS
jgi:hypothetical protein